MNRKIKIFGQIFLVLPMLFILGCGKSSFAVETDWEEVEESAVQQELLSEEEAVSPDGEQAEVQGTVTLVPAGPIYVHVCGAVVKEGLYEMTPGDRVADAIQAAGGFSAEAATQYWNLAKVLEDQMQILVPTKEELAAGMAEGTTADSLTQSETVQDGGKTSDGKININTADKATLCTLPGIGENKANSIIAYRQEHGNFSSITDIMKVSGIKEGGFQKIEAYITVGN